MWSTNDNQHVYATDGFVSIYAEDNATSYAMDTLFLLKSEEYTLSFTLNEISGYYGTGPDDLDLLVYTSGGDLVDESYSTDGNYTETFTPDDRVVYIKFYIDSSANVGNKWLLYNLRLVTAIVR
jgi:hypothetical protein